MRMLPAALEPDRSLVSNEPGEIALFGPKLFERHNVVLNIFLDRGATGGLIADVVERFGIFDAVFLAQRSASGENELFDVIAIGSNIIVAQERQLLAAAGQIGPELRAVCSGRPFRAVGAVRI